MKLMSKILSFALAFSILFSTLAIPSFAEGIEYSSSGGVYKIANDYVRFVYNSKTGGFSVETKDGHPQKSFDNNIPLLYSEEAGRSNGTSYTTVRIDGKDYIFGQDYSWFGIETTLGTPVIENGGRVMKVTWGIKGYQITQMAVISEVEDSDLAGNIGIGYTVVNTNSTQGTVGIRMLLDNALDSKIDAPYVTTDAILSPTIVETEYADAKGNMPAQLTYVDSLSNAKKMGYLMMKGWDGEQDTTPDKVIVGHWANLANTRYDYVPDPGCDFSNYSNIHRVPDTATAIYWSEEPIFASSYKTMEVLYGIGNFADKDNGEHLGVSLNVPSVKLDNAGTGYENNGEIEVVVTLDNSVDAALDLITAQVEIFLEDGLTFKENGTNKMVYNYGEIIGEKIEQMGIPKGTTKTIKETIVVAPAENITAKSVTVSVSGTEMVSESEWVQANYSEQRNILVPGVDGILPSVKMTAVSPQLVYISGEKNITVSGDMLPLKALEATTGWEMYLIKGDEKIRIEKNAISFPGDSYKIMTFSTDEELTVGEYSIELHFTDRQLRNELKDKIIAEQKLKVTDNEAYRSRNYGLTALVRFGELDPTYDFISFINEEELNAFMEDEIPATGVVHGVHNFNDESEVLAVVRGKIRMLTDENGKLFFQSNPADGDVTINNLLVYTGEEPLTMRFEDDGWTTGSANKYVISGNGTVSVISSVNIWHNKWSFEVRDGKYYTLNEPEDGQEFMLKLGVGGSILQYIAGFVLDFKYGVMTQDEDSGLYGITFGGKITFPLKSKKKDAGGDNKDNSGSSGDKDSGGKDSGGKDSGGKDSGSKDSGGKDSGSKDSGGKDSGGKDSGSKDSGSNDSGSKDSGSKDSGGKLGLTRPSGEEPPSLKVTNKDGKVANYINSLGTVPDEPDDGSITAEIEDVLFGQKGYNEETGEYETGFVGINCALEVSLPADLLGGCFKNKVGLEANFRVNTIDNEYGFDFGLEVVNMFECEATLELKQITVNSKEKMMLDTLKIYLGGDFMRIPFFGIPAVFVTGIGGGVSNIAEAVETNNFWAVIAHVRLDLIFAELLEGEFNGEFSSSYVKLEGEMHLQNDDDGKVLKVDGGLNIQWKPNGQFNFYGNASLLSGLISGGITIKIEKDYFYAYIYASFKIPDDIPIVGGLELSGFEAAGSTDFIGANLKIIGIKFGFIYYWGDRFEFGKGIDLSGRGDAVNTVDASYFDEDGQYVHCTAMYGTNLRRLSSRKVNAGRSGGFSTVKYFDPTAEDALLFEIPFDGYAVPTPEDVTIITPSGKHLELANDDGEGGGNFLINDRGENNGKFIYISITDKELLEKGNWTVSVNANGVTVNDFEVNGVDNLPELTGVDYEYNSSNPYEIKVNYELDSESDVPGALDVYMTENPDAISSLRQSIASSDAGLVTLGRVTLSEMKNGTATFEIPENMQSGEFTVLCMLSQDAGGMSVAASETAFTFDNNKLPNNAEGVSVTYGGNGDMRIEVERDGDTSYTDYLIKILDEDKNLYKDFAFEQVAPELTYDAETNEYDNSIFYIGGQQGLEAGRTYYVAVDTIRREGDMRYYSDETIYSDAFVMPEKAPATLVSFESNLDNETSLTNTNVFEATYTFDKDVYLFMKVDGLTHSYSTECKKVHSVSIPLKEGAHVIEFEAVTPEFDTTDSSLYPETGFGFDVDTTPPVLKVGQNAEQSVDVGTELPVAVSGQNVLVSEDGKISICGLTDTDVTLTLDGSREGVKINSDGSFTIDRTVERSRDLKELKLCAEDKAGNKTEILIHLVNPSLYTFDGVSLKADKEVTTVDDVKKISIPVGTTVNLSAFGLNGSEQVALSGTDVSWSVLYEQNIISFNEGKLTALAPGETAVCVIYKEASFEVDGVIKTGQLNDVIIVEVTELKVNVSTGDGTDSEEITVEPVRVDYADYSKLSLIMDKEDISSVVTVVDGKEIEFYYVGNNTYVASFEKNISDEDILSGLKVTESVAGEDGTKPERVYTLVTGDYDGNGVIDKTDITLAIHKSVGKNNGLNVDSFVRGDINGDGIINIIDAQLMTILMMKR